jgi:colanic acid biosynthesis glycosyl transferase WcaI
LHKGKAKILLYGINFAPELTGIGKYTGEMARWLASHGHEVRVVTAPPYYPQWKIGEGYSASHYMHEHWHGVQVWRCPVWVPRRASGFRRVVHLLSFAVSSLPVLFRQMCWRPHLIFVVEPPLVLSPAALLLAKLFGVRSWLHVQDFEVDAAFELGLLPDRGWLKKMATRFESALMRSFSAVSSISRAMCRRLEDKGVPQGQIRYFPNWVDLEAIRPMEADEPNELRQAMRSGPDSIVALYAGNMGEKQGLEVVLEAAALLADDPRIRLVLSGEGAAREKLEAQAKRMNLRNVRFMPLQPAARLNELLNAADIHLLVQKRKSSDLVMPSKLCGMLASGKCILATAEHGTAVHAVMEASGGGMLIPPEEPGMLAEALRQLARDERFRRHAGQAARVYAERELGYDAVMAAFQQSVMELGVNQIHASDHEQSHSAESI